MYVVVLPFASAGPLFPPDTRSGRRLRILVEPVERHFHKLSDWFLPARFWRRRSLYLHRRLDAGGYAVNWNLWTEDPRASPRRYLTLKRRAGPHASHRSYA